MENRIKTIVKAMDEKIARDIQVLEIGDLSSLCDYFIIGSAPSDRQVDAIAEFIEEEAQKNGMEVLNREGKRAGNWVLIDFGDIIVHVFQDEEREHYNLEGYWNKANRLDIEKYL
jgi:ribosome-associated protein